MILVVAEQKDGEGDRDSERRPREHVQGLAREVANIHQRGRCVLKLYLLTEKDFFAGTFHDLHKAKLLKVVQGNL